MKRSNTEYRDNMERRQQRILEKQADCAVRLYEKTLSDGSKAYDVKIGNVRVACVSAFAAMSLYDRIFQAITDTTAVVDIEIIDRG